MRWRWLSHAMQLVQRAPGQKLGDQGTQPKRGSIKVDGGKACPGATHLQRGGCPLAQVGSVPCHKLHRTHVLVLRLQYHQRLPTRRLLRQAWPREGGGEGRRQVCNTAPLHAPQVAAADML
jgi:hypothetical protein